MIEILVGGPGSGKSYYADHSRKKGKKILDEAHNLNLDRRFNSNNHYFVIVQLLSLLSIEFIKRKDVKIRHFKVEYIDGEFIYSNWIR